MVVFTCNSCGDSLKKNKVDNHRYQCRMGSLSCVDCLKDFRCDLLAFLFFLFPTTISHISYIAYFWFTFTNILERCFVYASLCFLFFSSINNSLQTYSQHIECITEDQKYGGLNFKQAEFKGKAKQNDWMQVSGLSLLTYTILPNFFSPTRYGTNHIANKQCFIFAIMPTIIHRHFD